MRNGIPSNQLSVIYYLSPFLLIYNFTEVSEFRRMPAIMDFQHVVGAPRTKPTMLPF